MSHFYISYVRVSTQKQGVSGLGLESQQKMIADYVSANNGTILCQYREVETATSKRKRVEIYKAMAHCKNTGAILVIAKLDRLCRDVKFLLTVIDSGIEIVFTDFKAEGIAGRMLLTIFAALAEYEGKLISQRTIDALGALKARGVKLGNPKVSEMASAAGFASAKVRKDNYHDTPNMKVRTRIELMMSRDNLTLEQVATALNTEGLRTSMDKEFNPRIIQRIIQPKKKVAA